MSTTQRLLLVSRHSFVAVASVVALLGAARERQSGVLIETKDLTPTEMATVKRVVQGTGKDVWLVYGFRHGRGSTSEVRQTTFQVYLQPDTESGGLRRGRMVFVDEPAPAADGRQQAEWRLDAVLKYAQVADGAPVSDAPIGRWDRQRPFVVEGEVADETLRDVISLVRNNVQGPNLAHPTVPDRVDGSLPVINVRRRGTSIEVTLMEHDVDKGQSVTFEERDGRLVVVRLGLVIA